MPFPFFRQDTSLPAQHERRARIERAVADGFRRLSSVLTRAAEVIEARRLERHGYEKQEKYLERVTPKDRR